MTTDNAPVLRSALPVSPSPLTDPSTITLTTDQHRQCLFVNIPGYGAFTPDQLIACLEAQATLGQARADAAGLTLNVERLSAERKTGQRAYDAQREALEAEHSRALDAETRLQLLKTEYNQVTDQLFAAKTAPRRQAVALMAVQGTQRRLILQVVTADTALAAFVEAKRIAALDRDGWYVEQFAVEEIPHVS